MQPGGHNDWSQHAQITKIPMDFVEIEVQVFQKIPKILIFTKSPIRLFRKCPQQTE